jgi:hypothetical protein
MLGKEVLILAAALEKELYRRLKSIPELSGALPVIRHLEGGDELWLFVALQEPQLEPALETRIISVLESTMAGSVVRCRVYQLSIIPVTRGGKLMQRAIERFVNHIAVPNRLQMRNPEVLEEIVRVIGVAGVDDQIPSVPKLSPL